MRKTWFVQSPDGDTAMVEIEEIGTEIQQANQAIQREFVIPDGKISAKFVTTYRLELQTQDGEYTAEFGRVAKLSET